MSDVATTDNTYVNTTERLILLSDSVDNATIGKILFNLIFLIKDDDKKDKEQKEFKREPIHIYINSHGGYTNDMWALIDVMLASKTPIYTYCTGYAMSAAFKIFLSGHKRFISKHAKLMYHQLTGWTNGKYTDMQQSMVEIDREMKNIEAFVISRTKITQERLDEVMEKKTDWFVYSEEAISLGIADEIL